MSDRMQRAIERRAAQGDHQALLQLDVQAVKRGEFPLYYPTARVKRVVQAILPPHGIKLLSRGTDLRSRTAWLNLAAYLQSDNHFEWSAPPENRALLSGAATFKAQLLDETRKGTPLYGGIDWFWNRAYHHTLREVPQLAKKAVHDTWLNHGLDLVGESPEHERLMEAVLRTPEGWWWEGEQLVRPFRPRSRYLTEAQPRATRRWRPPDPLPNPRKLTKDQWDQLVAELLDHGLSIGQAAEKYGVSQQAISKQLKKRPYAHRIYRDSGHAFGRRERKWERNGDSRRCSICGAWRHEGHCRKSTYGGIDAADTRAWDAELKAESDPFWYPRSMSEDDQATYGHKLDRGFGILDSSEDEPEDPRRSWAAHGYQVRRRPNPPKTVVLVSCTNDKVDTHGKKVAAQDLYMKSYFFQKARKWAEEHGDDWAILSAKHGMVMPTEKIATYDKWLAKLPKAQVRTWAQKTAEQLLEKFGPDVHYVALASAPYRSVFDYLPNTFEAPMAGMGQGQQRSWLSKHANPDEGSMHPPTLRNPRRRSKKPKISYEDTGETNWERFLNSIPLVERQRIDLLSQVERREAMDRHWWEWVEARKERRGEQPGRLFNPRWSCE